MLTRPLHSDEVAIDGTIHRVLYAVDDLGDERVDVFGRVYVREPMVTLVAAENGDTDEAVTDAALRERIEAAIVARITPEN